MKKNDLLVMSVVYILTSVIMFYINGLSKQFFTYVVGFPIVKSRLLCKMLYNVFTISTYQN
ncbi:hypothetical protein [Staphylococcus aureus]|uniref:hypothetical protein n=1 Tax=Staphylococcus aureus TaxID=1280 RepID=UPI00044A154E|nr:hypothetical protein W325_01865 [Staphylococcus aureus DAR5850]